MDAPKSGGPFKSLSELEATLLPLFKEEVAVTYLVWAEANLVAAKAKEERVSASLDGKPYEQVTQHYAARAYASVKQAVQAAKAAPGLEPFLGAADASSRLT